MAYNHDDLPTPAVFPSWSSYLSLGQVPTVVLPTVSTSQFLGPNWSLFIRENFRINHDKSPFLVLGYTWMYHLISHFSHGYTMIYILWLFNVAMENHHLQNRLNHHNSSINGLFSMAMLNSHDIYHMFSFFQQLWLAPIHQFCRSFFATYHQGERSLCRCLCARGDRVKRSLWRFFRSPQNSMDYRWPDTDVQWFVGISNVYTMWGRQTIAKLVNITPITMVYATYNYSYGGL